MRTGTAALLSWFSGRVELPRHGYFSSRMIDRASSRRLSNPTRPPFGPLVQGGVVVALGYAGRHPLQPGRRRMPIQASALDVRLQRPPWGPCPALDDTRELSQCGRAVLNGTVRVSVEPNLRVQRGWLGRP